VRISRSAEPMRGRTLVDWTILDVYEGNAHHMPGKRKTVSESVQSASVQGWRESRYPEESFLGREKVQGER
jgi:hypothetical protein